MAAVGWEIPVRDFCWGTTLEDSIETTIEIEGQVVRRVPRNTGFKARGTVFTLDGRCNAEFQFRCGKAWAVFWADIKIFERLEANIYRRMGTLEKLVAPSLFWCGGSLNLSKEQRLHLDSILRRMVIKMLNLRRQKGEEEVTFWKRLKSSATTAMEDAGIPSFQKLYWEAYWRWAGSMVSILKFVPTRVTAHVLRFKGLASLQAYAANDPRGRQGHVGCVHVWRWETAIFKFINDRKKLWYAVAKDRAEWDTYFDDF